MENLAPVPQPTEEKIILNPSREAAAYIREKYGSLQNIFFGFCAVWIILFLWAFIRNPGLLNSPMPFVFLGPGILYAAVWGLVSTELRHKLYEQFARANGLAYNRRGGIPTATGALFAVGHSHQASDVVSGKLNGLPLELFIFRYTIGHGKHAQTHASTVLELDFEAQVPPMLLLVDAHNYGDELSDNNLKDISKIHLADDLENHFNLFAERKFEIEALQIFTPEFLRELRDRFGQFSLDFTAGKMHVYAGGAIGIRAQLDQMFELAKLVGERIGQKLPSMQTSIRALNEALSKRPASLFPPSSRPGLRLMTVLLFLVLAAVIFITYYRLVMRWGV